MCQTIASLDTDEHTLRRTIDVGVALEWSLGRGGDTPLGVALAAAATPIILELALLRDYRKYITLALNNLAAKPDATKRESDARAEMSLRIAQYFALLFLDRSYADLQSHLERARTIAIEIGDTEHELKVLWMQHGIAVNQGNCKEILESAELYSAVASKSADQMADLVSHRLLSGALCDLGKYGKALEHGEKALRIDRKSAGKIRLNAYEMDHWVAARAKLAKILWSLGRPDDAKAEAQMCLSEGLKVGQEQTTCAALAFHVIPVAVWRG